jgi:hypothetical protein
MIFSRTNINIEFLSISGDSVISAYSFLYADRKPLQKTGFAKQKRFFHVSRNESLKAYKEIFKYNVYDSRKSRRR